MYYGDFFDYTRRYPWAFFFLFLVTVIIHLGTAREEANAAPCIWFFLFFTALISASPAPLTPPTSSKLGTDRLIMSRPVDAKGPFYVRFSPKRVMISGWVGDEDDTFAGLEGTLRRYLQSAWRGYANFGSDIGGYRTPQKPRLVDLFLRWTQLGAFSPLMENGGGGEHRPWLVDPSRAVEVTDIYRHFVDVHYALNAYLLSVGSAALENGTSSLHPLAPHNSTLEDLVDEFNPPTYCYLLGDRILVAPVLANTTAATGTAPSDVTFPTSGSWSYFFNTSLNYTGEDRACKRTAMRQGGKACGCEIG